MCLTRSCASWLAILIAGPVPDCPDRKRAKLAEREQDGPGVGDRQDQDHRDEDHEGGDCADTSGDDVLDDGVDVLPEILVATSAPKLEATAATAAASAVTATAITSSAAVTGAFKPHVSAPPSHEWEI